MGRGFRRLLRAAQCFVGEGHHFDVQVLALRYDGIETYVWDPLAVCKHCDARLPDTLHARINAEIEEVCT